MTSLPAHLFATRAYKRFSRQSITRGRLTPELAAISTAACTPLISRIIFAVGIRHQGKDLVDNVARTFCVVKSHVRTSCSYERCRKKGICIGLKTVNYSNKRLCCAAYREGQNTLTCVCGCGHGQMNRQAHVCCSTESVLS